MKEPKFEKGQSVWWTDPYDNMPKKVQITKCNPYASPEPFYTIKIMKSFLLTHSFERDLRDLEDPSGSEQ